ncbi:unnamed protein product [Ixodes hexagonus]
MRSRLVALLGCIWLSFALGILCTVFTVRLKIQTESILRILEGYYSQQKAAPEPQEECLTAACRWHSDYLWDRLNETVDPCDDFYAHVCSAAWFRDGGSVSDQPYTDFSVAQLMEDVRQTLWRQRATPQASWSFPAQAAQLLRLCYGTSSRGWDDVLDVLAGAGLNGWPYADGPSPAWSPLRVFGALERDLGDGVIASVVLRRNLAQTGEYQIHLQPVNTLLRRYLLHGRSTGSLNEYESQLEAVLSAFMSNGNATVAGNRTAAMNYRLAPDMVALEKRLEALRDVPLLPLERRFVRVAQLGFVSRWSWTAFLGEAFRDIKTVADNTTVVCDRCDFFRKVLLLVEDTPLRTLANYAGLRLVALLAPLLPSEGPWVPFLVRLSGRGLKGVSERVESCLLLLERVYRYGSAMLARMALGRQFPTVYRSQYDRQLASLSLALSRTAARRAARLHFLRLEERRVAQSKFSALTFQVLGTTPSLYWPALYYGVSSPLLQDSEPVAKLVALMRHTRRAYLASRTPSLDLDAQYPIPVFGPAASFYYPLRNMLFLPQSLVGFLSRVSNLIDASMIPAVGRPIVHGMLGALDASDGKPVDQTLTLRSWWSANSTAAFEQLLHCLLDQYAGLNWPPSSRTSNWRQRVDIESIFRDVASVAPLLDVFKQDPESSTLRVRVSHSRVLEPAQLFFVNFALSLCDHHKRSRLVRLQSKLGVVPSLVRANLALINSREFAHTFGCKINTTFNPHTRCKIW